MNLKYLVFNDITLRNVTYFAAHCFGCSPHYLHVKQLCASIKQIKIRQCMKILGLLFFIIQVNKILGLIHGIGEFVVIY